MERLNPWVNLNNLLQHLRIMFYVLKIGRMEICDNYTMLSLSCIGEGNGNPLQGSCLENPRDRGGWRAAIYGVAQSRT